MIADEQPLHPFVGSPDETLLDADAFHEAIVTFIEQELPVWRDRMDRPDADDEPRLNESLCDHLDCAARHSFDIIRFTHEPLQTPGRAADLAVKPVSEILVGTSAYSIFEQLLPIECKRLPTPRDNKRSDCEYVHGVPGHRTGAIERFKHRLHGPTNDRAMIIGYVQSESFDHWLTTINARLTQFAAKGVDDGLWAPSEIIATAATSNGSDLRRLKSSHRRTGSSAVHIRHLWLSMN